MVPLKIMMGPETALRPIAEIRPLKFANPLLMLKILFCARCFAVETIKFFEKRILPQYRN
jgi:hypothetical protein